MVSFLGISIDGSALEIDQHAHAAFYGSPTAELPRHLPESASQLRNYLVELTHVNPAAPVAGEGAPPKASARKLEALRRSLIHNAAQLQAILSPTWRQYLVLPKEIVDPAAHPNLETLMAVQQRFAKIDSSPNYKDLVKQPEFQATYELLREYVNTLSASRPTLQLPPPPEK